MEETMDTGFEDFFGAFDDGGDHTDITESAETPETTENGPAESGESEAEAAEGRESGENSGGENTEGASETGSEGSQEADGNKEKRSFDNIKVNGEIHSVSYEDAPAWIQKGMDYDRVKNQLAEARQQNQTMSEQMEKHKDAIDVLEMIAGDTGMKMDDLLHNLHKSFRMQQGETEKEAEANIRAAKAEREASAYKARQEQPKEPAAQEQQTRMQREYAEFRAAYPDVRLDDALTEKLGADVAGGMSLLGAYQKMQAQEQAAKIAALERQLEAEKQNRKNAATSPGSQKDSGGQRKRDPVDDFFDAFNK